MKKPIYDKDNMKTYKSVHGLSQHGSSYIYITCPFCGTKVKAFIWSLCGGGKKCLCGALHTGYGLTLPLLKQNNEKSI